MTPMVFILVFIGVGCVSDLLMRFIIWLDGAGECKEDAPAAELAYYETFATKQEAMRCEAEIKRLTRQEKPTLIKERGFLRIDEKSR